MSTHAGTSIAGKALLDCSLPCHNNRRHPPMEHRRQICSASAEPSSTARINHTTTQRPQARRFTWVSWTGHGCIGINVTSTNQHQGPAFSPDSPTYNTSSPHELAGAARAPVILSRLSTSCNIFQWPHLSRVRQQGEVSRRAVRTRKQCSLCCAIAAALDS